MTGLYLHIPFCRKKCHYCNFVITSTGASSKRSGFLSVMKKEIAHHRDRFAKVFFDTLYFGGGTPSQLNEEEMADIFVTLRSAFRLREGIEITCEVNPGDVDLRRAQTLKTLGFNRISLGAQSFHDATLKRLNRSHYADEITRSFHALQDAGFKNINLDLILSLPGETLEDVKFSLERAVKIKPQHVSLYELCVEEKTVFGMQVKKGTLCLPSEETQVEMLAFARRYLKECGFEHYELLNYCRPGFGSKHNLLYWENRDYLGLGPGAFSYFDGRRFQNSETYEEYISKIGAGDWSATEEETLTAEKRETESFLLALRLTRGVRKERFSAWLSRRRPSVDALRSKGMLAEASGYVRLTPQGQFFAETVFTELSA